MQNMHTILLSLAPPSVVASGAISGDLDKDSSQALSVLVKANPIAADIYKKAKATLIFPNILRAGRFFGRAYGYVVFLMSDKLVKYIHETQGWEVGVGSKVVTVDVTRNMILGVLKDDAYAFIFDQQGLMVSLSIEGTKISRITK